MLRGIRGTYVYVCDPELKKYFESHIPRHESDSVNTFLYEQDEEIIPFENSVPLYDLKVAAGSFGDIQNVEEVDWIKVPKEIQPNESLFACQVIGESMNKIIPNGAICLFKKYSGGSRNGQIVLVENTSLQDHDFGSCYTIKEYESKKYLDENGWKHHSIILKPQSYEKSYSNIELNDDELNNLRVIGIFEKVLK